MSDDMKRLILSELQNNEIWELRQKYKTSIGSDVSEQEKWLSENVISYLDLLMLEAAIGHKQEKVAISQTCKAAKVRSDAVRSFDNFFQRKATAEDIIQELLRAVPVPEYIADFIRRDMEKLRSTGQI